MNLAQKLTVTMTLGVCAVLGVNGYLRLERERDLFETDIRNDQRFEGKTLTPLIERIWEKNGETEVRKYLDAANRGNSEVKIRWVWLDAPRGDPDAPSAPPEVVTSVPRERYAYWKHERGREAGTLYSYFPVHTPGTRPGAIELAKSMETARRYVHSTLIRITVSTAVAVILSGLFAALLGFWFVGKPMRSLVEKARKVGSGDLTGPLVRKGNDEFSILAGEMNEMCDRLRAARDRLAAETEARLATLDQLRHADRLATVGKLASGVAHELGTPLNVISGRAQMIGDGEIAGEEVGESAKIIAENADRMTRIIRHLLDFSRRRKPEKTSGDIRDVVRGAVHMLKTMADKNRVDLKLEDAPGELRVEIDAVQMEQVLTNLVVNGIQAMPGGGILKVTLGRQKVRPPADRGGPDGEYVYVSVEDQGEGIAPEHIPHVFEPFFTTKDIGQGTGLGLSVSYGLVQDHAGWISVESEIGKGSRFTVYLPKEEKRWALAS